MTTVADLYDMARLVDTLENVHFFWRTVVAGDMPTPLDIDLNTTYACMSGTNKHMGVSYVNARSVQNAVDMMDTALGGKGEFRKKPFCSISCCYVVSPLRFAKDSCDALEAAIRNGMSASLCSAPQSGATSPVTLAGSIVQTLAECFAGLVYAFLIDPNCRGPPQTKIPRLRRGPRRVHRGGRAESRRLARSGLTSHWKGHRYV